ncbi:DUF6292 family protein [Lentzea xinjiangensis]|nr:DUF6292 family protein [Lentzea xinjiangensis]
MPIELAIDLDTDIDFDVDFDDSAARRARGYVSEVVVGLGLRGDSSFVETEPRAGAYVALEGRLPDFPHHDVALQWNELTGWSVAVEDRLGQLVEVARLSGDAWPEPSAVARWVGSVLRHERAHEQTNRDFAAFVPSQRSNVLS